MTANDGQLLWWHFSDVHWASSRSEERSRYFETLFEHLTDVAARHGAPGFIVISGDLTASGKTQEYNHVSEHFVRRLKDIAGFDSTSPLLIVPGNHDLDRKKARIQNPEVVRVIESMAQLDTFFESQEAYRFVGSPFDAFKAFHLQHGQPKTEEHPEVSWAHEFQVGDSRLYVAGINTAWASSYITDSSGKVDDRRQLLVGLHQITRLPKPSPDVILRILVLHHPLTWLKGFTEVALRNLILGTFDLVLQGHVHTTDGLAQHISPAGRCVFVPAPVLHDRADTDSLRYARGYNVVRFDVEKRTGQLFYYRYADAFGSKLVPFVELYESGTDHFPIDLQSTGVKADELSSSPSIPSNYEDVLRERDDLQSIDSVFHEMNATAKYDVGTLTVYDQLFFQFISTSSVFERDNEDAIWEAFVLCRTRLILQLIELHDHPDSYRPQRVQSKFRRFIQRLRKDDPSHLVAPSRVYEQLVELSMERLALSSALFRDIQSALVRYIAPFCVLGDLCFFLNNLNAIAPAWSFDQIIGSLKLDTSSIPDVNLMAWRYEASKSHIYLETRVRERSAFVLVNMLQHYGETALKHVADLWRQHHRVFPPVAIILEFPLWTQRGIEGNYLTVEPTPIVRLLMGKGFYGGTSHIWFRELLQNALDANATRAALEGIGYHSRISIVFDDPKECAIADNGIGMSSQHILQYLTRLGRSIWGSQELVEDENGEDAVDKKSLADQTIGKFGIGFASVFQESAQVHVLTRFFRDDDELGWHVEFASIEKPFFMEQHSCDAGTEVRVVLNKPLRRKDVRNLVFGFFLYIGDNIDIRPNVRLPATLEAVELVSQGVLGKCIYSDECIECSVGESRFRLRTLFVYSYSGNREKDPLPLSRMLIANSGVNVFQQNSLFVKPGKRYIWQSEEEEELEQWKKRRDAVAHYWVIVDFAKGHSPILPSRIEIDIDSEFATELRSLLNQQFCHGLESVVSNLAKKSRKSKSLRDKVLRCLKESVIPTQERLRTARTIFSSSSAIQDKAIEVYKRYCPLRIASNKQDDRFECFEEVILRSPGTFVLDTIARTSLFKVYARALSLDEWVLVSSIGEFALAGGSLGKMGWTGIYEDKDIYKYRQKLFTERTDALILRYVRGDYALVDSDIFDGAAFILLPANLPKSWKPEDAARHSRSDVSADCPARILLNSNHRLFVELEQFLNAKQELPADQDRFFRLAMQNLADGVIEQRRKGLARERWNSLREQFVLLIGESLKSVNYDTLRG